MKKLINSNNTNTLNHKNSTSTGNIGTFLMFLFWPFGGFLWSFKNYKFYSSRNATWLFIIYFGLTFFIAGDSDSNRYYEQLLEYRNKEDFDIFNFFKLILFDEASRRNDFIQPLITYLVSRVSGDSKILFAAFGMFLGYFYTRNCWFLIDSINGKVKVEALVYLLFFFILVPFWQINGFRFWAATHVFIYGLINYIGKSNHKKGIALILLSILIHDTFIISIAFFFLFLAIKNKTGLIFYSYLFSFLVTNVAPSFIKNSLEFIPFINTTSRSSYLNEDYVEGVQKSISEVNWYIKYQYTLTQILMTSSIIWIYYFRRKIIDDNRIHKEFLNFGLIILAFTNIVSEIPSMSRFYYIGALPISIMLFLFFQNSNFKRRPDWYKVISLIVVSTLYFAKIWQALQFFSLSSFLSNPFTLILFDEDKSVFDLIKQALSNF